MKNTKNKKNVSITSSGRSMIEMLGVLAIIGVLSVGGIAGYSKAMHRYKVNKSIEQITYMIGAVRSFFAPQKNYVGVDDINVLKKAKLISDEMIGNKDGEDYLQNVWGYDMEFNCTDKIIEDDCKALRLNYYIGNNEEACIDLLTYDWSAVGVTFIRIKQAATDVVVPVSLEKAVEICSAAIENTDADDFSNGFPNIDFFFDADLKFMQ